MYTEIETAVEKSELSVNMEPQQLCELSLSMIR